jgi:putative PEP-CTERM system histidine kinase
MRVPDDAIEPTDGSLARFLLTNRWVINLEEFRSSPERYAELHVPPWLAEVPGAWLVVPLATGSDLIGFVILATARTQVDVNWEVNDLLKTAGRQAASYLGQMQATEALLEARKFDAFNRMSAFVVHDLKNIVSQLSLMVKNAERHRDNPEFQQDMLMTVEHAVERMKQLMMQLREGTTPVDAPQGVDLADVVRRIQRNKSGQQPVPELQLEEGVAAKGHQDRLERVIGHIVQNALDATQRNGRVWIKLTRENGQAVVEIGDTGHGMTPEFVRDRLFKPFQTTKQTGMGIGAYESFQYVQELGGRIGVDSAPNVGTRVRLLLPLFEPRAAPAAGSRRAAA